MKALSLFTAAAFLTAGIHAQETTTVVRTKLFSPDGQWTPLCRIEEGYRIGPEWVDVFAEGSLAEYENGPRVDRIAVCTIDDVFDAIILGNASVSTAGISLASSAYFNGNAMEFLRQASSLESPQEFDVDDVTDEDLQKGVFVGTRFFPLSQIESAFEVAVGFDIQVLSVSVSPDSTDDYGEGSITTRRMLPDGNARENTCSFFSIRGTIFYPPHCLY